MLRKLAVVALALSLACAGEGSGRSGEDGGGDPTDGRSPRDTTAGNDAARPRPPPGFPPAGLADEQTAGEPCTGPLASGPAVLCVDHDNAGGDEQGTAEAPYATIAGAVDAARAGDTIQVAGGSYAEAVRIESRNLHLLGGFAADFTSRRPAAHLTTISAVDDEAALVLLDAGQTVVEGFRLTAGGGSITVRDDLILGGGLAIVGGAPTIAHNLIEGNDIVAPHGLEAAEEALGAGVYAFQADLLLQGNLIRNNRTGRGVVATSDGRVRIVGNAIVDNVAIGDHGAGLYLAGPQIEVVGNLVAGNLLQPHRDEGGWGGGIMVFDPGTEAELRQNVVTDNFAPELGAGVFVDDGARATLQNELIVANRCGFGGAGLYVDGLDEEVISTALVLNTTIAAHPCEGEGQGIYLERAELTIGDSIVWGNGGGDFYVDGTSTLEASYTLSEEGVAGAGNFAADPLFGDPAGGDFHLRSTVGRWDPERGDWVDDGRDSPAIDAGDPALDVADEPEPNGGRINLGAYGGTAEASLSP